MQPQSASDSSRHLFPLPTNAPAVATAVAEVSQGIADARRAIQSTVQDTDIGSAALCPMRAQEKLLQVLVEHGRSIDKVLSIMPIMTAQQQCINDLQAKVESLEKDHQQKLEVMERKLFAMEALKSTD